MRAAPSRAGIAIVAIGVFHECAGLILYRAPLLQIVDSGVWNSVIPNLDPALYGRQAGFWFMIAGLVAILFGALAHWAEARTGMLPRWLGWALIALTLAGGIPFPTSGFWLFLIPAAMILRRD